MHRVRETLAVTRLVHRVSRAAARHTRDASQATDTAHASLLDAAGLRSDHVHTCVVVSGGEPNRGAARALVWARVVDAVNLRRMMAWIVAVLQDQRAHVTVTSGRVLRRRVQVVALEVGRLQS